MYYSVQNAVNAVCATLCMHTSVLYEQTAHTFSAHFCTHITIEYSTSYAKSVQKYSPFVCLYYKNNKKRNIYN